jgi:AcrR family transcriptional regulator
MRRRAEQVDQTRQRITEATIRLHTTVGPSQTSIAAVAEAAGVTRLTVYRHFSDLDALFQACTAHWFAQNPRPDPRAWLGIERLEDRAELAFSLLYRWYREHGDELYPIYRDADVIPAGSRQATAEGYRALADSIVAGDAGASPDRGLLLAVARHLVGYWTWRSLAVEQGLGARTSVSVAVRLLLAVAG